jgi:hypothetical protein
MIKPFEASDLIAAVQSIAQRLLAPAPAPRGIDHTVQLRTPPGQTIEDTIKMTKPAPPSFTPSHEDTLRIPPPNPSDTDHEQTIRLTAQEIKAFQDTSYSDWKNTAEPHLEDHEKAELERAAAERLTAEKAAAGRAAAEFAAQEGFVTPAIEEPEVVPPSAISVPEEHAVAESAAMLLDPASEAPAAPIFAVAPEPSAESAFFASSMDDSSRDAAPIFAVEPEVAELAPVTPPLYSETAYSEAAMAPMTPALEAIVEAVSGSPAMQAAPAPETGTLETNAPLTPGPMPVAFAAELEPTSMPATEVAAVPASGLEVTSPAFERGPEVAQDPGLVTETDDMSQFVTKFGVEGAEPVHVGIVSDLSDEQVAAITSPVPQEPEPVADATHLPYVVPAVEPQLMESEAVASPIVEQVGSFQAVAPMQGVEPVVAYVPDLADSQSFPAVREPDSEAEPMAEAAAMVEAPIVQMVPAELAVMDPAANEPAPRESALELVAPSEVEPAPEPSVQMGPATIEAAPIESAPEPVIARTATIEPEPEVAAVEAVSSLELPVASVLSEPEPSPEHVAVAHAVETALAAAAGTAVAGFAHVVPDPAIEPIHEVTPASDEIDPRHELFGDAALAEELAAALSNKEGEDRHSSTLEVQSSARPAPSSSQNSNISSFSDGKLADAVARAFESLKPQLITEIIKELAR